MFNKLFYIVYNWLYSNIIMRHAKIRIKNIENIDYSKVEVLDLAMTLIELLTLIDGKYLKMLTISDVYDINVKTYLKDNKSLILMNARISTQLSQYFTHMRNNVQYIDTNDIMYNKLTEVPIRKFLKEIDEEYSLQVDNTFKVYIGLVNNTIQFYKALVKVDADPATIRYYGDCIKKYYLDLFIIALAIVKVVAYYEWAGESQITQ